MKRMENRLKIRVGSRKSQLALVQTEIIVEKLKQAYPNAEFEIVTMDTIGDNILDKALSKIGEKSLFTKELEIALANKEVDLVVHSLKDLPTTLPPGMAISAICRREDPSDAVIIHSKYRDVNTLDALPNGSIVGTSSLRRTAQLQRKYPHLKFESIRGNLNTRLRKLDESDNYSAIILATAGICRLGLSHRIAQKLTPEVCMHAVGQGALAVEVREDDSEMQNLISCLNDNETAICCLAERAFMKTLEGGCSVPIAVNSSVVDAKVHLTGGVFSLDGTKSIIDSHSINEVNGDMHNEIGIDKSIYCGILIKTIPLKDLQIAEQTGAQLAEHLKTLGAEEILSGLRQQHII